MVLVIRITSIDIQSLPITTEVCVFYSIPKRVVFLQHYVMKFVCYNGRTVFVSINKT
jgi:hypothetical protein